MISQWMSMGDYTFYVWSSVSVVLMLLGGLSIKSHLEFNRVKKLIEWQKNVKS